MVQIFIRELFFTSRRIVRHTFQKTHRGYDNTTYEYNKGKGGFYNVEFDPRYVYRSIKFPNNSENTVCLI